LNITLPKPQLIRIDDFVSTHNEYKDRSDFLFIAASKLMQSSQERIKTPQSIKPKLLCRPNGVYHGGRFYGAIKINFPRAG
jgi:Arc/MetJ-type ribon-helix-helix transcriptional regulator